MVGGVDGGNCYSRGNGYLVQVIVPGGKRCFCIRAGLGRREAYGILLYVDLKGRNMSPY